MAVTTLRAVILLVLVATCAWRIFGGVDPTVRFFDDFFYYIKPAQNWVEGSGANFFPGEPTNGYHPLWFLFLTLIYFVTGGGAVFFALVDVSVAVLLMGFFFLFERFCRKLSCSNVAGTVGASVATIAIAAKAFSGLEMALTAFSAALLLAFLVRKPLADNSLLDAFVVGVLGSVLVLSRLDAVMIAPGLLVAVIWRWDWRRIVAALVGATPVGAYLAFNWFVYGHVGTTSMAAKSLAVYFPPNWHFVAVELPLPGAAEVGIVVLAALVLIFVRICDDADARRVALALTAAPLLQFAAQALLSGWKLFPWYLYYDLMVLGLVAALATAWLQRRVVSLAASAAIGMTVAVAMAGWYVSGIRPDTYQRDIATMARELADFERSHPGIYAMGDAAGTPAWVMSSPIVHLEGLMMSHEFVDRIASRQPLEQVFRDYHIDYYVTARPQRSDAQGCSAFLEPSPAQSSDRAPHMAITICEAPTAEFRSGGYTLRIFNIDRETGKPV